MGTGFDRDGSEVKSLGCSFGLSDSGFGKLPVKAAQHGGAQSSRQGLAAARNAVGQHPALLVGVGPKGQVNRLI
ncbi:hypothetical protein SDC9_95348 [bioreactor metagenome]|uniref:Uncharacterized protein n=1 Tax=bioreactor metagenome TaxID=1076179 RepID=A0A645A6A3_9ZZZZ